MAHSWIGLCARGSEDDMRRALTSFDPSASVTFAGSAMELRHWACEATLGTKAIVGLLDQGMPAINVAAALVRDGSADEVVLVDRDISEAMRGRAHCAGIGRVVDTAELVPEPADGLDELNLPTVEVPTMVMAPSRKKVPARIEHLPRIDDVLPTTSDGGSLPKAISPDHTETSRRGMVAQELVTHERVKPLTDSPAVEPRRETTPALPGGKAGQAPVITFVSGRGGTGKTSLVAAMGYAAASWGMRVALCDLDLSFGNLYSCFGLSGPADLAALGEGDEIGRKDIQSCAREAGERMELWGPCALPEMAETVAPKVEALISELRDKSDLVLIDTSVALTDAVAQAAQLCDRLVIVVDMSPGSAVAQARLASLAVRLGVARTRMVRLANRCGQRGRKEPIINRADVGLETARSLRVQDGGHEVTDCLAEGRVDELFDLGSRFAESCASVLAQLLAELGVLPQSPEARRAFDRRGETSRWNFGWRRKEVG